MSDSRNKLSAPTRLLLRAILNVLLVWAMATYLSEYFQLTGGIAAVVIVGALLTLMNIVVRPILGIVALPLKLFAMLTALVAVNGLFVWLIYVITQRMDAGLVSLQINGIAGWIVTSIVLGIGNWVMKAALK